MWSKHPKSLPFLFLSEMWERFGYYLMIGIFTLYLKDTEAGFGMSEKQSADLYGTFIALVFLTPFLGGLIADRYLGYYKSIIIGGLFMAAGYMLMGIKSLPVLYLAMFLVIVGNGFFKPNISTLLGSFYGEEKYKTLKDEGYNVFYMGINIGAFVCNFFGAALYNVLGWTWAFFAAGIGMIIGVVVFMIGAKHYGNHTSPKGTKEGDMPLSKITLLILLPSIVFGVIGWFIKGVESAQNPSSSIFGSDSTDAFIFACIPVILFYTSLFVKARPEEKRPIGALLTIFAVVIMFWAVFKLNGTALNTWANNYTDRTVTGTTGDVMTSIKLASEINYVQDSVFATDAQFRPIKENGAKVKVLDYPSYFKNVTSEQLPIGLLISGLSVLVMVAAVKAGNNGAEKVSVWWLVANYGVITIGELFLSPMGLSLVSKLSPVSITSLMMGGWFLATSIGNKLSGVLASMWDSYENKADFFWVNFALLMGATLLMFLLIKKLNVVMREKGVS